MLTFRTHLFSILPPSFSGAFKALVASTLPPEELDTTFDPTPHGRMWAAIESLGLLDRYESIIASVGYEHIEAHVLATCTGQWEKPMLEELKNWMSDKMVTWMLLPYARGAKNGELYLTDASHAWYIDGFGFLVRGRSACDVARRRLPI